MSKYDTWLANQPSLDYLLMEAPSMVELIDNSGDYPVDEWVCRDCKTAVGYNLVGDHGGGWTDYWLIEQTDEMVCDDCMTNILTEPDYPTQPDCDRCGALAGDEHSETCN